MRATATLALVLAASPAAAQSGRAAEHQIEADRLYKAQRYREALDAYVRAQALAPGEPIYLYSRARCHHQLAQWSEAVVLYDAYLAAERTDAGLLAKARRYRAEARAALEQARLRESAAPPAPSDARAVPQPDPESAPARPPDPSPTPGAEDLLTSAAKGPPAAAPIEPGTIEGATLRSAPSRWPAWVGVAVLVAAVGADVALARDGRDGASDAVPLPLYGVGGALALWGIAR